MQECLSARDRSTCFQTLELCVDFKGHCSNGSSQVQRLDLALVADSGRSPFGKACLSKHCFRSPGRARGTWAKEVAWARGRRHHPFWIQGEDDGVALSVKAQRLGLACTLVTLARYPVVLTGSHAGSPCTGWLQSRQMQT